MKPITPESLAAAARSIKDAPTFISHIEQIAERYAREHAADINRPTPAQTRRALADFQRQAAALAQWLERSDVVNSVTRPEQDAMLKMNALAPGDRMADMDALGWLIQRILTARTAYEQIGKTRYLMSAARIAADSLAVAFANHELRFSGYRDGAAVNLLLAIAKAAGDRSLTTDGAKAAITKAVKGR